MGLNLHFNDSLGNNLWNLLFENLIESSYLPHNNLILSLLIFLDMRTNIILIYDIYFILEPYISF